MNFGEHIRELQNLRHGWIEIAGRETSTRGARRDAWKRIRKLDSLIHEAKLGLRQQLIEYSKRRFGPDGRPIFTQSREMK